MAHEVMCVGAVIGAVGGGIAGGLIGLGVNAGNGEIPKQPPAVVLQLDANARAVEHRFDMVTAQGQQLRIDLGENCIRLVRKYEDKAADTRLVDVVEQGNGACGNSIEEVQKSIALYRVNQEDIATAKSRDEAAKEKLYRLTHPKPKPNTTGDWAIGGAVLGALGLGLCGAVIDLVFSD